MLTNSLNSALLIFKNNYADIAAFTGIVLFTLSVYIITLKSLRRLKPEILNTYPFDLFFPGETKWSAGYFLVVIVFLSALIYFLLKGNFYLSPA